MHPILFMPPLSALKLELLTLRSLPRSSVSSRQASDDSLTQPASIVLPKCKKVRARSTRTRSTAYIDGTVTRPRVHFALVAELV